MGTRALMIQVVWYATLHDVIGYSNFHLETLREKFTQSLRLLLYQLYLQ